MIRSFIKDVFIPEKIGNNYIFSKRIISFDIGKTQIHVSQVYIKGTSITIEKCLTLPIENDTTIEYPERAAKTIRAILDQLDKPDEIHTAIASPFVVIKELKLPFIGHSRIAMVVDFEVEPLLPFPLEDAVIDFIITKQIPEENSSEILIAAVQKQYIAQHLQPFEIAGVSPQIITIDMFALYGLYTQIPSYAQLPGPVVLLDIGSQATHIAYIYNGQLRLIRSLPKGALTIAKNISTIAELSIQEATQILARFGLESDQEHQYTEAVYKACVDFWQDIAFTLASFTTQFEQTTITRILLLGSGSEIKGLPSFIATISGSPCDRFSVQELLQGKQIFLTSKQCASSTYIMSLSIAWPSSMTAQCNVRKKEFQLSSNVHLLIKQLATTALLIVLIFTTLLIPSFIRISRVKKEIRTSEHEMITILKTAFKNLADDDEDEDLETFVQKAENEVNKEEKLWFSLANPARTSFLKYLLELTEIVDKDAWGFEIEKLIITETTLTLVAQVRDYPSLSALRKALRKSKLFAHVEGQDDPNFTMHIKLAKNE